MADFAVGDQVIVYTQDAGVRRGTLVALPKLESHIPMPTVRLGDILWAGPELHVFPADKDENEIETEVSERLARYGQELAERRAEREAQLEAALASEKEEETEAKKEDAE